MLSLLFTLISFLSLASAFLERSAPRRGNVIASASATSSDLSSSSRQALVADLQKCVTPEEILDRVGRHVTPKVDPTGSLSSVVWVRYCKLLIRDDNNHRPTSLQSSSSHEGWTRKVLHSLTSQMRPPSDAESLNSAIELTKAACLVSRLEQGANPEIFTPVIDLWARSELGMQEQKNLWEPHHLSGLHWAYATFRLYHPHFELPLELKAMHDGLKLPFEMLPGCIQNSNLLVDNLIDQVDFRADEIRTSTNQIVTERRKTAWQGDVGVSDFLYSGKSMQRQSWSPLVESVRNQLQSATNQYYDCCLLNLYPNGESGMRYHIDPDQGDLWDYDTAVVSVGATRRVAFRDIPDTTHKNHLGKQKQQPMQPHSFYVMSGDVMYMFGDCQTRFQHTVKKAESKNEAAARSSLVFKRTWNHSQ